LYPEFSESDMISAFHEDDLFIDHLEEMFGASVQRPGWDQSGLYTPETIEIYFETRPDLDETLATSDDASCRRLLKVSSKGALGDVLSHPNFRIVDGIATFFILSSASAFTKMFRKKYKKRA
jgi:hypothetical protein